MIRALLTYTCSDLSLEAPFIIGSILVNKELLLKETPALGWTPKLDIVASALRKGAYTSITKNKSRSISQGRWLCFYY